MITLKNKSIGRFYTIIIENILSLLSGPLYQILRFFGFMNIFSRNAKKMRFKGVNQHNLRNKEKLNLSRILLFINNRN